MANFEIADRKTSANEGGYANVKGDNGGETYAGIARRFWSNWEGWSIVDQHKPLRHNQKIKSNELDRMVKAFYKKNFWDVIGGDSIEDQRTADILYDFGVNAGQSRSIRQIEKILGFPETGKISESLINAINNPINHLL